MQSFREVLHKGYEQVLHLDVPSLADERSDFQHILIFDSKAVGRVLVLDGIVQLTTRDEASYSEMLSHLPILEHGKVRRVLIVGGGDGAVAEEVLKHRSVDRVDLVDIDARVIELCRKYFPEVNKAAFEDSRLRVMTEDAFEFLERAEEGTYDLVIADRPDPVGPAESLFASDFYQRLNRALAPGGFAVFQTGCPFLQAAEFTETLKLLKANFEAAGTYLTVTPTYVGGHMALTWAGKGARLGEIDEGDLTGRFRAAAVETDYYTPALHHAAFALPRWIERLRP